MQRGSTYSMSGFVVDAPEGKSYQVCVTGELGFVRMLRVAGDRSFSLRGLIPGVYSLELIDSTPGLHWGPSAPAYARVEIKASNVQDVRLVIKPALLIVARVTVKGAVDTDQLRLFLRPTSNPTARLVFSQRGSDGAYTFRTPSPEPNVLTIAGIPEGMVVRKISFNGEDTSNGIVDLSLGGGQIDILIGPSGGH